MMKKLVVLIACLGLSLHMTGCTSNDTQADSDAAVDMESADLEQLDGDEALEIASDETANFGEDPAAALGETDSVTASTETDLDIANTDAAEPADPFAEAPAADVPADTSSTDIASTDPMMTESTPTTSEFDSTSMGESVTSTETETTTTTTYPGSDSSVSYADSGSEPAPKVNVPLQKVPTTPWKSGGVLYNTVYFARPGDTFSGISKMLYGSAARVSELKQGNASFASRGVKPGDKVYYNSPIRPTDDARMITYYEDNGLAPDVYVAQNGDNIRSIASKLLGHPNAWKEVWASNTVESKGEVPAGTELRYWKNVAAASAQPPSQELASSVPIPPPPAPTEMPPAPDMSAPVAEADPMMAPPMPEDPMAQQAQNDIPPPPPMPDASAEMPPPPPAEAFNPPAPPQDMAMEEESPDVNNNSTMALGVVGIGAIALAALMVMRKKRRQRELDQQAFDSTQVGT